MGEGVYNLLSPSDVTAFHRISSNCTVYGTVNNKELIRHEYGIVPTLGFVFARNWNGYAESGVKEHSLTHLNMALVSAHAE